MNTVTSTVTELAETVTSTVAEIAETVTSTVNNTVTNTVNNTVKRLDLTKLDAPRFQMPALPMLALDKQAIALPVDTDRIAELARDAAYVGVGAIVVIAQQADETVRSVAGTLTESVSTRVRELVETIR